MIMQNEKERRLEDVCFSICTDICLLIYIWPLLFCSFRYDNCISTAYVLPIVMGVLIGGFIVVLIGAALSDMVCWLICTQGKVCLWYTGGVLVLSVWIAWEVFR
jgi:hypothetical protein